MKSILKTALIIFLVIISSCRFDEQYEPSNDMCIPPFDIITEELSLYIYYEYTLEFSGSDSILSHGPGYGEMYIEKYLLDEQYKLISIHTMEHNVSILFDISINEQGLTDIQTRNQFVQMTKECCNSPDIYNFLAGNYKGVNYGSGNISIGHGDADTSDNIVIYLDLVMQEEIQNYTINLVGQFIVPEFCD